MAAALDHAPVAFLAAGQGTDQAELAHAWYAVLARGGQPVLVSPSCGEVELRQNFRQTGTMAVDIRVDDASAADFAGLVLPGGLVNADQLRLSPLAVGFVRDFFAAGLPVAAICHAPWLLIDAGVVRGRRVTSWPSIRSDLRHAGACWVDDHVVVCEQGPNVLVTSRGQNDLPAFCQVFTEQFGGAG